MGKKRYHSENPEGHLGGTADGGGFRIISAGTVF